MLNKGTTVAGQSYIKNVTIVTDTVEKLLSHFLQLGENYFLGLPGYSFFTLTAISILTVNFVIIIDKITMTIQRHNKIQRFQEKSLIANERHSLEMSNLTISFR